MTGDGMCSVFIPDRVLAGWWRSQWKASDREWAGRCITGCGRGQVYKCECEWDHCGVIALIYLPPSTTCYAPTHPHTVTRLPLAPPPACQNPVMYKYTTHPIPCHTSSTFL